MSTATPTATAPKWAHETFEATLESIQAMAVQDFSQHLLEATGEQEWWCHRPRTGAYSFRVIVRHSAVIVYGDIGAGIFRGGEAPGNPGGTLGWLREAVYHPTYLLSKRTPRTREFYAGDALEFAAARDDSPAWKKVLDRAQELWEDNSLHEHSWVELVYGDTEACSFPLRDTGDGLWLVAALRWFVEHLPAEGGASNAA